MAVGSLSPAFVQISYHSPYAPHVMTIPTREWEPGIDGGTFQTWEDSNINAVEMVEALVDKMKVFFVAAVSFDSFTIFTQPTPEDLPVPRFSAVLDVVGTNASSHPYKAIQQTWTAKAEDGSLAKLVFLDMQNAGNFERLTFADLGAEGTALLNEWFAETNGWSSRLNARPYFYLQTSTTVNEKLRKQYHMT